MNPILDAALRSWPAEPWLLVGLVSIGAVYGRGWLILHRRARHRWHCGQLAAFWGGLATIYLALASPIESFAPLLLQVHMVQHVLLMMAVPPLVWLGAPLFPLLRGLPEPIRTYWIVPLLRSPSIRRFFASLTHPAVALPLFVIATWLWHWPAAYELAVRSSDWHYLEHLCFLGTGLLLWFPVVRPYPSRPRWSAWILLPYLFLADVQNTVLSALLTFSSKLLYPYYAEVPRLGGLSALADQSAAGVIMWVPGSIAFLVPLFWIGTKLLYGERLRKPARQLVTRREIASPPARPGGVDLLRFPLLGRMLKWRHARVAMQVPMFLLAALLIADGLRGPQIAPMNLAGVLPWIHWRGLLILSLLALGNVFCMACPFMLPRKLARRLLPANRNWPRWLRSKWVAVGLIGLFLWAYEAFSIWDSPWWTAWIAIGYFVAAIAIDGFFRGAAFCKYLCPIGQFNFVQSLISPLEIKIRQSERCVSCATKECIRGGSVAGGGVSGCELNLYQPRKAGNMDCTFCLDCVHACPHDNIGILVALPGKELWHDPLRSGIGRFSRRKDLAALVLILVFGAFANAAGMVGPVVEWQRALQSRWRLSSSLAVVSGFYLTALVVLPLLTVAGAAAISHRWAALDQGLVRTATRYCFALLPLGFAMWLSHYSFHLLSSYDTAMPAAQRFAADLGISILGPPQWSCSCCRPVSNWLPQLEILFLDVGLLLSLYTAFRIALVQTAQGQTSRISLALKALVPWALLIGLLFAAGIWIVLQPMQMRGMMPGG